MNYEQLAMLAERSGLGVLLDRAGLRANISQIVRLALDNDEVARWDAISRDYVDSRQQFESITRDIPPVEPEQTAWIVASMNTHWGLKLDGVMSIAARLAGYSPVGVYPVEDVWSRPYHSIFQIRRTLHLQKFRSFGMRNGLAASSWTSTSILELLDLQYHNVDVGRIALSNVLTRRKFEQFDLGRPDTLDEVNIELALIRRTVDAAEAMLETNKPSMALLLEKGLSPVAEISGVCLANGVPVVQYVGSQNQNDLVLKRYGYENRHQHPFSMDASSWQQVCAEPFTPQQEEELMREFEEAYFKGTWFNRKFLHQDKRIKPADEVRKQLELDPSKKTAVVFSHVLWDATFFYGKGLFENYESWLIETIKAACSNTTVNWVIKLHPDLVWKLKYERHEGELRDLIAIRSSIGALPPHMKMVGPDTDISSYSFFGITDYCVTVRGTIGIEMSCHGVPVITAGTGRYSGHGFTLDSTSREEYLSRLANIASIQPMPSERIRLARRFAYTLFKKRLWPMRTFEIVKERIQATGHPLDHTLVPHIRSYKEAQLAPDLNDLARWLSSGRVDYLRTSALHV